MNFFEARMRHWIPAVVMIFMTGNAIEFLVSEETRPVGVLVFGGTVAASKPASFVYADGLHDQLLLRGVASNVWNESLVGSHSGSRMDNNHPPVAHGMDRFSQCLIRYSRKNIRFIIIHFGLEDAWIDGGQFGDTSRIPLELYKDYLISYVDRIRHVGAEPILVTPNPMSDPVGALQRDRLREYVEAVRFVSEQQGCLLVDFSSHLTQLSHLNVESLGQWLDDGKLPTIRAHEFLADRIAAEISGHLKVTKRVQSAQSQPRGYTIPMVDISGQTGRRVLVDREPGQYLGHPTTCLLEDGKTMLCVYPKGHGRGPIVYKRSMDGGLTWSDRIPVPENWSTSLEVPTIHRVIDPAGNRRLILWSGLYPARLAVSQDDGLQWSPLAPAGDWGGIVVMGCLFQQNLGSGRYMAMFHDDGRFFQSDGKSGGQFTLYKTFSTDGGLSWHFPEMVTQGSFAHLCEPGVIRSPDGRSLAILLRENSRRLNSHVIFSDDEGMSWSGPRELPAALTGDRHTAVYSSDGRLFISFRDTTLDSPTQGDWVAWVGRFEDIQSGGEGEYRIRLMDNKKAFDCAYPGVEILPDDTIVTTTYGHWAADESPYIVSVRLKLSELDALVSGAKN